MGGFMSLPALKDLFARHRDRATGLWRLGLEPTRTIFMEAGDVVFAISTHPTDRLTHLLVERGKITQAQLDYAMTSLNPAMSIGKNLIEMGFITQRDLLEVARSQVERVVWTCLAAAEDCPAFEAKELDATTVRLPFDTPAMLLSGVLALKDRERVLEELGPLNQVVVLEGRRFQDLTLPADLARLPDLLDGSRTLMELSRESGIEPFRLGAFVLFLREMGWARLHELPPLDRRALELALDPPEPPLTQALPEPAPEPQPSLFAEIHASQIQTTNLEHLHEALDQLGAEAELKQPEPQPEPEIASTEPSLPEPSLPIFHGAEGSTEPLEPPPADPDPQGQAPRGTPKALWLALILLAAAAVWAFRSRLPHAVAPAPKATAAPKPHPTQPPPSPVPSIAPTPVAKPAVEPAPPAPLPAPPPVPSKAERMQAILQGNWKLAMAQGALQKKALDDRWTLRLEIACEGGTVQNAAKLLKDLDPDLFLMPMSMRDGRTCYQVFLGSYGSEAAAKAAAGKLPAPFLAEGNRPKPFRAAQIPDRQ
jgi:septal ring-binding cell division protein DamX